MKKAESEPEKKPEEEQKIKKAVPEPEKKPEEEDQEENAKKRRDSRRKKEKSELQEWIETALYAIIAVGAAYLIVTYLGQRTIVNGSSMIETLHDGDNVITDKITYRFRDPERFDIVVFPHYDYLTGKTTSYIKRIIGLPGETVQIIDGYVYIDGEKLEEDIYGQMDPDEAGYAADPITIGEDEYFVLGDNRSPGGSRDSRSLKIDGTPDVGLVSRDIIIGRAVFRIWPLGSFGSLK